MQISFNKLISITSEAADKFGFVPVKRQLQILNNLTENKSVIDVAVLGQFKAGKSSFINNLLQKDILPVGVIPVTSVITRVYYGEREYVLVRKMDGSYFEIDFSEIESYVSERKNPSNIKKIFSVDIILPELERFRGLRLVDTPGIGSINLANTEAANEWIPETGTAIMLVSAERPLSKDDIILIQDVKDYCPEVVLLLTKTDLFSAEQLKEITHFIHNSLQREIGEKLNLFPYTIYNNQKFRNDFEKKVLEPLIKNIDEKYQKILRHKLIYAGNSCLSYLNIAYSSSLKGEQERDELRNLIFDEHTRLEYVRQELLLIATNYKNSIREKLSKHFLKYAPSITAAVQAQLEKSAKDWRGNLSKMSQQYENFLKENLTNELQETLILEHKNYMNILNGIKTHYLNYSRNFRQRLNEKLSKVLGIQTAEEELEIGRKELIKPDILVSKSFEFHIDLLWFLFPMFIFRNLFMNHFRNQIPGETEKNLHRLISDLTEKVHKEIDSMREQVMNFIYNEITTIENLLSQDKKDSTEIKTISESIRKELLLI
jgi:GTP-binding protein EngB required for normal cell division